MLPCPYLSAEVVKQCLERNIAELVRKLEAGLRRFSLGSRGGIVQPVRNVIPLQNQNGMLLSMSAHSIDDGVLATKVVTYFPENKPPRPSIQGSVLLFDAETGSLKCMMDAVEMTAYRTASVSAVATKYLATENPKILAVFGSGTQAKSHIVVFAAIFNFQELITLMADGVVLRHLEDCSAELMLKIRIWNHREESALSLASELMTVRGIRTRCVSCASEAARDADVIVTATSSPKPILQADWLKKGAHVNAVGAPRLDWQELSSDVMLKSVVYVDSVEGAMAESGDIVQSGFVALTHCTFHPTLSTGFSLSSHLCPADVCLRQVREGRMEPVPLELDGDILASRHWAVARVVKAHVYAEIGEVLLGTKENRRNETTVFKSLGMAIEDALAAEIVYRHAVIENK